MAILSAELTNFVEKLPVPNSINWSGKKHLTNETKNHAHTVLSGCPDFQGSQVNCSTYAEVELRNQFSHVNACLGTESCATKAIKRTECELGEGQHVLRYGFSNILEPEQIISSKHNDKRNYANKNIVLVNEVVIYLFLMLTLW